MTTPTSQLFYDPVSRPTVGGVVQPQSQYNFYVSGTSTPAPVYQDAALTTAFPVQGPSNQYLVTADGTGAFPPIYLNPSIIYRVQWISQGGITLEDVDPHVPAFPVTGNGPISINAFGEVTINAPTPGGTGVAVTVVPSASGKSMTLAGSGAGNPAIIINTSVTVGTTTASFVANNKPGFNATGATLTVAPSGTTYTGGTLTANWAGPTGTGYNVTLSTGQVLVSCTLTNGSTAFTCPSTNITPTPTTSITVTSGVQKWVPISCDNGTYYFPAFL